MTLLLASVTGPQEAAIAAKHGADIIDLKESSRSAFGAVTPEVLRATVAGLGGRCSVSAVTGELPMEPDRLLSAAHALADAGAEYVKVGLFQGKEREACIRALSATARRTKIIGVMFAEDAPDETLVPLMAESGFAGAMLDTARKDGRRLLDLMDITVLGKFVDKVRARGLLSGLAGSLEPPDIPRLLLLAPDVLGFRGALCLQLDRAAGIDPQAVDAVRALIPADARAGADRKRAPAKVDYSLLAMRASSVDPRMPEAVADRVFVHDLVLPARVGVYGYEHEKPQQVRFNVDVMVTRSGHAPEDMRDVFSYDVIKDGIRMIVAQEHIPLVEALAERVASFLLAHPRVLNVRVRVEKLEVGPGAVGVEIVRERPAEIAKVHHLYPAAASDRVPGVAD